MLEHQVCGASAVRLCRGFSLHTNDRYVVGWVVDVILSREPSSMVTQSRTASASDMSHGAVLRRLDQHQADIRRAIVTGSEYGTQAEAILRESARTEDGQDPDERTYDERGHEVRAGAAIEAAKRYRPIREARAGFGTDGGVTATAPGEASALVPPNLILSQWASYRTPFASFASQCKRLDIPPYGLNLYVPDVTGAVEVTSQVEGSGIAEKLPTTGLIKGAVVNKAGQIEVSQQILDRVGPSVSGDTFLFEDLKVALETAVDEYALSQSLAGAQEVNNSEATFEFSKTSGVGGSSATSARARTFSPRPPGRG